MHLLTLRKIAAIEIWHGNYDTKMHCNYVVLYDSSNYKINLLSSMKINDFFNINPTDSFILTYHRSKYNFSTDGDLTK